MATINVCDFCKGHPLDLESETGGDVAAIDLKITGASNEQCSPIAYSFHCCATCRERLLSPITINIGGRWEPSESPSASNQTLMGAIVKPQSAGVGVHVGN